MKKNIFYVILLILSTDLLIAQTDLNTNDAGNMVPKNSKISDSNDTLKLESSFSMGDRATETISSYWTLSTIKDLYYNGGKVGIGTSRPITELDVAGTIKATGFILPGGNTGDVLTYGSLGTAYWAAPSIGGGSLWNPVTQGIVYNPLGPNSNVGIGTNNPISKLDVNGVIRTLGFILPGGNTGDVLKYGSNGQAYWDAASTGGSTQWTDVPKGIAYTQVGTNTNVGIGTSNPLTKLDVNGVIRTNDELTFAPGNDGIISFGSSIVGQTLRILSNYREGLKSNINGISITSIGNVGIGIDNPTAKLEVDGKTITNSLQITGGVCQGDYVLSASDENGNAIWKDLNDLSIESTWDEDENGNIFIENGHVTIGGNIPSPSAPLMVKSSNGNAITIGNDNATSTSYPFNMYSTNADGNMADFVFYNPYYRSKYSWKTGSGGDNQTKMALYLYNDGQSYLQVYGNIISEKLVSTEFQLNTDEDVTGYILQADANGNASWAQQWNTEPDGVLSTPTGVAIGTTTVGTHALAVNGSINAKEILVTETVPGSDYVFENDYSLMPLHELESFVKENKHLPEVMSANEFKENGYNLGKMDDVLLRKVEELTLYMIQQQKEIDGLKEKLENINN